MNVWKFPLSPLDGKLTASMPFGAKVLHVGSQAGTLCVWALVNPKAPPVDEVFFVYGTGHEIPPGMRHVGTAQMDGQYTGLVFHLFMREGN